MSGFFRHIPGVQDKMYQDTLVIDKTRNHLGSGGVLPACPTPQPRMTNPQPSHTITGALAVPKPNHHNLT